VKRSAAVIEHRDGPRPETQHERKTDVSLRLVDPERDTPPALTPPPNPSKPEPERYAPALFFLAAGMTAPEFTGRTVNDRAIASIPVLIADGWTQETAFAALRTAGSSIAALRLGPPRNDPPLRLVRSAA
jgi:hypothetical protein